MRTTNNYAAPILSSLSISCPRIQRVVSRSRVTALSVIRPSCFTLSSTRNNNTPAMAFSLVSNDMQPAVTKTMTDFLPSVINYSPISGSSDDPDSAAYESESRSY